MTTPPARVRFRPPDGSERLTAGASWSSRVEPPEAIASRVGDLLGRLALLGGGFSAGFTVADEPTEDADLTGIIAAAVGRTADGKPHPRLGYSFTIRGRDGGPLVPRLRITAGAEGAGAGTNRVVVGFDAMTPDVSPRDVRDEFERGGLDLLAALIGAWQPDEARLGGLDQITATSKPRQDPQGVVALTWLADRYPVPAEIPGAEVVRWLDGSLIGVGSIPSPELGGDAAVAVAEQLRALGVMTQSRPEPPPWLLKPWA